MPGYTTEPWWLANEAAIRLGIFSVFLVVLFLLQWRWPRRAVTGGLRRRAVNLALVAVDTIVLRLAFPLLAFDLARRLEADGQGLLHGISPAIAVPAGILLLDFVVYWQHRLLHRVPLLWRLHRMHHADLAIDVTTGVRFHPIEIVLSMLIKLGVIAAFGIPAVAVLAFEVLLNAGSLFTHANLALPSRADRVLRWLIVTPDMHRVHHSWRKDETNSNYGFHLSIWDRLFRSYRDQPVDGHQGMTIGLKDFRKPADQSLLSLLLNPLRDESG